MSYYKHTNGESFTIDGNNYVGYFNIIEGVAYTGRLSSSESEVLSSKDNFINSLHINELDIDTSFDNVEILETSSIYGFDIINREQFKQFISIIDVNNTKCYKSLIANYPPIFKFKKYGGYYYGLSDGDPLDRISLAPRNTVIGSNFFRNSTVFDFLSRTFDGIVVVDSEENFKYICMDSNSIYFLTGDFNGESEMRLSNTFTNLDPEDLNFKMHHDKENQQLFIYKSSGISIYDISNYSNCEELILVDYIRFRPFNDKDYRFPNTSSARRLDGNDFEPDPLDPSNISLMAFGGKYRSSYYPEIETLLVLNKYNDDDILTIDLSEIIGNVVSIDMRDVDDLIVVMSRDSSDNFHVTFFNPFDLEVKYPVTKLDNFNKTSASPKVKFLYHDSNIISTSSHQQYQYRYISSPRSVIGDISLNDFSYPQRLVWGDTQQYYKCIDFTWSYNPSSSSSFFSLNHSTDFANDSMYLIMHNSDRIYVMKQPIYERYITSIPLDLPKFYKDFACSETSAGLNINIILSNILKDTLNLYNKAYSKFTIDYDNNLKIDKFDKLTINNNDLITNGNETLNSIGFQRVVTKISEIQDKLLPKKV